MAGRTRPTPTRLRSAAVAAAPRAACLVRPVPAGARGRRGVQVYRVRRECPWAEPAGAWAARRRRGAVGRTHRRRPALPAHPGAAAYPEASAFLEAVTCLEAVACLEAAAYPGAPACLEAVGHQVRPAHRSR